MALQNVERVENQLDKKSFVPKLAQALIIASTVLVTASANAAGLAATLLEAVTGEVTAIGNSQEAIYGLLIVVLVGFMIWRYSKRTVNSG